MASILDEVNDMGLPNRRIYRPKHFAEFAKRGKTSMRCFLGFKLHQTINCKG
ncbi:transposase [Cardiobacterium hominis]|uniref:transposase n=1 Tax=Cardiobacterium hominis TaxID=2718 RepID=UPI0036F2C9E9